MELGCSQCVDKEKTKIPLRVFLDRVYSWEGLGHVFDGGTVPTRKAMIFKMQELVVHGKSKPMYNFLYEAVKAAIDHSEYLKQIGPVV